MRKPTPRHLASKHGGALRAEPAAPASHEGTRALGGADAPSRLDNMRHFMAGTQPLAPASRQRTSDAPQQRQLEHVPTHVLLRRRLQPPQPATREAALRKMCHAAVNPFAVLLPCPVRLHPALQAALEAAPASAPADLGDRNLLVCTSTYAVGDRLKLRSEHLLLLRVV